MAKAWLTGFGDEIDHSLEIQMRHMESLGIYAIEFRGVDGKNVSQLTTVEAKEIRRRMTAQGFSVSALGSPIGKTDITAPFEQVLETFKRLLETADILHTNVMRIFSFYIPDGKYALCRNEVIERLGALVDLAKQGDVLLYHENEGGIYGDTSDRCVDLMQNVNDESFALIYDPSNFVQSGYDPLAAWFVMKPYVRYLHMKDSHAPCPGTDAHSENPHCVVGDGDGRLREVLTDIAQTGWTGYFSVEPHLGSSRHVPGTAIEKWAVAANGLKKLLAECGISVEKPV